MANTIQLGASLSTYAPVFFNTDLTVAALSYDCGCPGIVVFDSSDGRHWLNYIESHTDPLEVAVSLVGSKITWDFHQGFRYYPGKWSFELQDWEYGVSPLSIPWLSSP